MAVTTNKNEWAKPFDNAVNGAGGSLGGGNPQPSETPQTDKYSALETTSYKDLLSSKIQAANARDQAFKYANASLGASGFAGQGMAESTRTGILNNYNKAIVGADEQHQQNMLEIAAQRANDNEVQNQEDWQTTMTMLNQASSQADLDYIKSEFYPNMTEQQKKIFDYYYSSYSNDFVGSDVPTAGAYSYQDQKAYAYGTNGEAISTTGRFNYENETLNAAIATGRIDKDSYIQLRNTDNQDLFLYYGKDGKLYYINKDTFESATQSKKKQYNIYGQEKTVNEGAYSKK